MPDLDAATLAERVLRLSRTAPFDQMTAEDLTALAAAGREQTFPTRTVLVNGGERAAAHYVPLAGRLRVLTDRADLAALAGESGIGVLSVLGMLPLPADLIAEPGTVLLILDRDALLSLLEEGGGLLRNFLRLFASKLLELRRKTPSTSGKPSSPPKVRFDLVSRMLVLREALGFGGAGMAVVSRLARVTRARAFPAGTSLWTADHPADLLIVVEGSVRLSGRGSGDVEAGWGEVLGLAESVAGVPMEVPAIAIGDTTALVLSHAELAEAIEDDDALCFELIRIFAGRIMTRIIEGTSERTP